MRLGSHVVKHSRVLHEIHRGAEDTGIKANMAMDLERPAGADLARVSGSGTCGTSDVSDLRTAVSRRHLGGGLRHFRVAVSSAPARQSSFQPRVVARSDHFPP